MCVCVCETRRAGEGEMLFGKVGEVICKLLSSSGANIHKVCLSRVMEIYIIFFSDEVCEQLRHLISFQENYML